MIMLFVIAMTAVGNAQETVTVTTAPVATSKVVTELLAASSTKVVKGSPFSAEAISESTQVLADGNRIVRNSTTKMYRDSDGRFRREGSGNNSNGSFTPTYGYGSLFTAFGFQETISINDPVDGVRYTLNPSSKTARRFSSQNTFTTGAVIVNGQAVTDAAKMRIELEKTNIRKVEAVAASKASVGFTTGNVATSFNSGKSESLGTKTIEGVETEGTRTVTTIAAGSIGNEKPIEIVYERWFSKELDLIVYSRHYDPRFGEQIYRLTNISRNEPDRSLFTVPSDYKLIAETAPVKVYTTTKQQQ